MSCIERPSPPYPQKITIAVFGKKSKLKEIIGKILNYGSHFVELPNEILLGENNKDNKDIKIIDTPDLFDEACPNPDQQIIDFMALSHPGPHLFILAIDSGNTEEVIVQISKLVSIFGEKFTAHLIVALPDIQTYHSFQHLKDEFQIELKTTNENLASECTKWCLDHQSFLYDYKDYSKYVVMRRREYLSRRHASSLPYSNGKGVPQNHPKPSTSKQPSGEAGYGHNNGGSNSRMSDYTFNIVLLGQTGTGKSASGNTILAAVNSQQNSKGFESWPNSVPVTTECKVKMVKKFGRPVKVVDTPDFFHDELNNPQTHIEECKKYCQPGQFVALLVMQLGRITDGERGMLEKLEQKLGCNIRENAIVLLTHGDNEADVKKYIEERSYLDSVVEKCGNRYHVFNNTSKDPKQVTELIKKIPNYEEMFPKFSEKTSPGQACCIC